ncbi:mCG144662, partial [Mus musculus]
YGVHSSSLAFLKPTRSIPGPGRFLSVLVARKPTPTHLYLASSPGSIQDLLHSCSIHCCLSKLAAYWPMGSNYPEEGQGALHICFSNLL